MSSLPAGAVSRTGGAGVRGGHGVAGVTTRIFPPRGQGARCRLAADGQTRTFLVIATDRVVMDRVTYCLVFRVLSNVKRFFHNLYCNIKIYPVDNLC